MGVTPLRVAHAPSGTTNKENVPALKLLMLRFIFEGALEFFCLAPLRPSASSAVSKRVAE
jgi:hypothetical protein